MAVTFQDADRLFRRGEFAELLRAADAKSKETFEPRLKILIAHALALTGNLKTAVQLAATISGSDNPSTRARASLVLGIADQARGDLDSAKQHFRNAVRHSSDSKNPEFIAWAHLYLFRLLIEGNPAEASTALLPEVRRVVTSAGDPHVTAYLHISVSTLEGQTGRLSEASRHCDIADSLLDSSPNSWLRGSVLLNRASIACLAGSFDLAARLISTARELTAITGHAGSATLLDSNLGYVQTMRGRFDQASSILARVLSSTDSPTFAVLGATESLARLGLATSNLQQTEHALDSLSAEVSKHPPLETVYHVRWSVITRSRLHLKLGNPTEALGCVENFERRATMLRDAPLSAALNLVAAVAHSRLGQAEESARRLMNCDSLEIRANRDLQPQFYFATGAIAASLNHSLMSQLQRRARMLWGIQGITAVEREIDLPSHLHDRASTSLEAEAGNAETVADSLAAMFDVAYAPTVLGAELLATIKALRCSDGATLKTRRDNSAQVSSDSSASLDLGVWNRRHIILTCPIPKEPTKAILLADLLRVGRAAVELERARQEERSRAALWPASPAEEQHGALFLAEEMRTLIATAKRIAPTGVPVLITGETGTGKEVLARLIHAYSPRAEKTFLPFNCGATPKDMLDSQLFGHRRGAFTGASEHFSGVIRAAAGGTLFLDEIGETTLDVQPKLLRFLESNEVHPLGETQPVRVDVRVIAATNADLETLLAAGRFREDLFYRLNIVRLHVPPLRERRVEIPALANHYLRKYALECGKGDLRLAEETMEYLVLYKWPGNVRQLANEMRRLAALAEPGAVLMPEHLVGDIAASRRTIPASERVLDNTEVVVRMDQPMNAAVQHLERAMLQFALARCQGRIEETAGMLGLSRKGLYLKRLRFGLETPSARAADVA